MIEKKEAFCDQHYLFFLQRRQKFIRIRNNPMLLENEPFIVTCNWAISYDIFQKLTC